MHDSCAPLTIFSLEENKTKSIDWRKLLLAQMMQIDRNVHADFFICDFDIFIMFSRFYVLVILCHFSFSGSFNSNCRVVDRPDQNDSHLTCKIEQKSINNHGSLNILCIFIYSLSFSFSRSYLWDVKATDKANRDVKRKIWFSSCYIWQYA